jgi:hypothetical protein
VLTQVGAPIQWSLAGVSQSEFRKTAFEAEKIWEKAIGKELFIFNNSAPFQLRTFFDDRQKMTRGLWIKILRNMKFGFVGAGMILCKQYKNKKTG